MTGAIQFAVLGLGVGATYVLLGQGLVIINQGSGVLNLAHGVMAMLGVFIYWQVHIRDGWALAPSLIVGIGSVAVMGALTYQLVMRPLVNASTIAKVVATLGLLVVGQSATALIWGVQPFAIQSFLPTHVDLVHGVFVPRDRFWILLVSFLLTFFLWLAYRYTPIGLAIRASAQNPRSAAALGWSPHLLGTATWALGSASAALAGILIAPLASVSVSDMPLLVVPATAAALIGGFTSFWLTFIGAIAVGIGQAEIVNYVPDKISGAQWGLPFIIIVLLLVVRGKGLPARGYVQERLPAVGSGIVRWRTLIPVVAISGALLLWVFPDSFLRAAIVSLGWATIMLSVVVLLGYTAQLSFEQMAMAGLAALAAARVVQAWHWPFELAFLAGVVVAVPVGLMFAIPALRTRGINLAVVTLGLGVVIFEMLLTNSSVSGGPDGVAVGNVHLFGIDINSIRYPGRYACFVMLVFVFCALIVRNVRRGRSGSALIAVRSNERAAAALGISVFQAKTFAFVIGSTVAAFGGLALGFRNPVVHLDEFGPFESVLAVSYAVIGGVGLLLGPLFGSLLVAGGFGGWLIGHWIDPTRAGFWLALAGGIAVVQIVITNPNGLASLHAAQWHGIARLVRKISRRPAKPATVEPLPLVDHHVTAPATLEVDDLTVRFGAVTAVDSVSLTVKPGQIVGLIGPNGAGKTSLIDAVTGFVRPARGDVSINGVQISQWPAYRRTRQGLSRSFQQLELFESSTLRENLRVASDERGFRSYLADLVHPSHRRLSDAAAAAVGTFELDADLDTDVSDLPYGRRRLAAIARAIAVAPSILLLDEPAAGLGPTETQELAEVVRRLADEAGFGILLVEHDVQFVMSVCDSITVLDFGRTIAHGTPDQIRNNPAVIAAYLGSEAPDGAGTARAQTSLTAQS